MKFRNRTNKQNSTNYSDHWLAFKNGDNTGLESIYKDYAADLMAYGYRIYADEHLVKDVIQDVFIKLLNNKNEVPTVENVKMYLLKSLRNRLYRKLSTQGRYVQEIEDTLTIEPVENSIVLEEMKKEQRLKLHFHIQQLPNKQREIIHLKFYQNLSNSDIAKLTDTNYQSVSNTIYRAISTLKIKLRSSSSLENHQTG